ncbi:hypothetical protein OPS25_11525 [Alteromonas ponticola]|uniref:Uncharacterized protein n=1 Tax=Alteromonas aquimaris TaxID=2998417 RepID=A0ABT3P8M8_9ALTE|nr:hypothetical protein [Alteromonas aquimaris]MCW8109127.1 hypothetical protein [Alteromonas aquimaris]
MSLFAMDSLDNLLSDSTIAFAFTAGFWRVSPSMMPRHNVARAQAVDVMELHQLFVGWEIFFGAIKAACAVSFIKISKQYGTHFRATPCLRYVI